MNLYWPVYKSIETEVLSLSSQIHFSDDQLSVYSIHIADLIVRCAVEIEAISKELYKQLGGNMNPMGSDGQPRDLYFDTDCMKLLNDTWHLDKKLVTVTAATMYFQKTKDLHPLHKSDKRGTSGSKWKKAYQTLKHDRYGSLKQGTIENLLNALGALYILNIYYADDSYEAGIIGYGNLNFKSQYESKVFTPGGVGAYNLKFQDNADDSCIVWDADDDLEAAVYIGKYNDEVFRTRHFDWCVDQRWAKKRFNSDEKIQQYLKAHPEEKDKSIEEICLAVGGKKLLEEIVVDTMMLRSRYPKVEVRLNKGGNIYPAIPAPDEQEIDKEILTRWAEAMKLRRNLQW